MRFKFSGRPFWIRWFYAFVPFMIVRVFAWFVTITTVWKEVLIVTAFVVFITVVAGAAAAYRGPVDNEPEE